MAQASNELLVIDWVRRHFGIKDEAELRALLADPSEMQALLDVAKASGEKGMPIIVKPRSAPDRY